MTLSYCSSLTDYIRTRYQLFQWKWKLVSFWKSRQGQLKLIFTFIFLTVVCLTILAFAVACVLACDPDGNNEPQCDSSNLNQPIRNFWDPTRYWLCKSAGAAAESVSCPISQGFDSAKGECVPFDLWLWTAPCPAS